MYWVFTMNISTRTQIFLGIWKKIYAWYKENFNFERARVDSDVLPLPRRKNYTYGDYDPLSIMHYDIDSRLTHKQLEPPINLTLSRKDLR